MSSDSQDRHDSVQSSHCLESGLKNCRLGHESEQVELPELDWLQLAIKTRQGTCREMRT